MNKLPQICNATKILIICEGEEEYDYLKKLNTLKVWDPKYSIKLQNAKSIDNIFAKYQYEYANRNYKLILIFCDTDMEPYAKFNALIEKLNDLHGNKSSNKIVIFGNPCTFQIIVSHFVKTNIKTNIKQQNGKFLEKNIGIKDYRATEKQRKQIMDKITVQNYNIMKSNLCGISVNRNDVPSTNALSLFENLENYKKTWISNINKSIEK